VFGIEVDRAHGVDDGHEARRDDGSELDAAAFGERLRVADVLPFDARRIERLGRRDAAILAADERPSERGHHEKSDGAERKEARS